MKPGEVLLCAALLTMNVIGVNAAPPIPSENDMGPSDSKNFATGPSVPVRRAPTPLLEQDKVLSEAYYDTLGILSEENACSEFFGGPASSVMVFNRFMSQVRKDYLANSIGMRMSGGVTSGFHTSTNTRYRMFDRMSVNVNGPFYRKKASPSEPTLPRVGGYEPSSKEVRVLMLLHELGHLVKGDDDKWLLPDDGKAETDSHSNSAKIEEVCGDQIKSVTRDGAK